MAASLGLIALLFACAFLLGSIPWGVIISRVAYKKDIRNVGSGNIGATNALRAMGKRGGASVFLLDMGKGVLAGLLGGVIWPHWVDAASLGIADARALCGAIALLGCVWGHIFSPWLKFKGGKGISVAFGCLFCTIGPIPALIELAVFIVMVALTRYVSLGSVMAAVALMPLSFFVYQGSPASIVLCCIAALTVIWAHRGNISRIAHGEERRLSFKKKEE